MTRGRFNDRFGIVPRLFAGAILGVTASVTATWLVSAEVAAGRDAMVGAVAGSLVLLASFWPIRAALRPMYELAAATQRIAGGALDGEITGLGRTDQIGAMARAIASLRDACAETRDVERRAVARASEESARHAALLGMVDKVESETTQAIGHVGARTRAMTGTAEKMTASATRTGFSAASAADASSRALENAETGSSAAERLSLAIQEIGARVSDSGAIVARAVETGNEARGTIAALNEEVGRIGAVADMISEIAARTNLLALNATIEAARAGAAGKGFAVVAAEVKVLAGQTARSTEEIASRIARVRDATAISVRAVAGIEKTIGEIDAIAGKIAGAVEEQARETAEIARTIAETAAASRQMAEDAARVAVEADQTCELAADVCRDADGLNTAVDELQHAVIRVVRTSGGDLDRRRDQRFPLTRDCQVSFGGERVPARLVDLSERGAFVQGPPGVAAGARGTLMIDGVGFALPFVVRASDDDAVHVAFDLDPAIAERFRGEPERLAARPAA